MWQLYVFLGSCYRSQSFTNMSIGSLKKKLLFLSIFIYPAPPSFPKRKLFRTNNTECCKFEIGINQSELLVLERHTVYSLSKEKTAAYFYIMQSVQLINEESQVPIKDAIERFAPFINFWCHNVATNCFWLVKFILLAYIEVW